MGRKGFLNRVRSWFGAKVGAGDVAAGPAAKHRSLGPLETELPSAFERRGATSVATATRPTGLELPDVPAEVLARGCAADAPASAAEAAGAPADPAASRLDPLDPVWMKSLEDLPRRIAEAMTGAARGTQTLDRIAAELYGHRQTARAVAEAVRRLPDMAANQAELTRDMIRSLERQVNILEAMFDAITALRSAFRTVDESSKRHLLAISQLEACHRQVLLDYQRLLLRAHGRLGWMALAGIVMGAAALGGMAYALIMTFAGR